MLQDIFNIPVDRQLWFVALFIWVIIWKGIALWKAARLGSKPWFIGLLIVNTLGVLEILYVYVFSRPHLKKEGEKENVAS